MHSQISRKVAVCRVYSSLMHAEGCQLLDKKWGNQFVERVQEVVVKQVATKMFQFVCNTFTNVQLTKKYSERHASVKILI
jgi:hypothetical protein